MQYTSNFSILASIRFGLILSSLILLLGCNSGDSTPSTTTNSDAHNNDEIQLPIEVVTTTGMITDLTKQIAGERAEINGLIQSGIDPHLYQPTRNDIQSIMSADLVFYNGLLLEGKMTDALIRVAKTTPVHAVTEELEESYLLSPDEFAGHHDPHVWMDPVAWKSAASKIRDALIEYDPAGSDLYQSNAMTLIAEIDSLYEYALESLGTVPQSQRVLVTAHDAFNYFGQRFGFEVVGIQGISTESEAGVRDIERIVDLLVNRKISAVFVETTVSQRNIQALIAGAADRGHQVKIGGSLFSDAMGNEGTYEGTYIGMIDHNITTITKALGGSAPTLGMNGKLNGIEP
ncbi:MAG: zinc ABC transporter substrate-binding protein [Phycisphaerales bacterium]|nr:zinc ABC transporter substrate-binding protein [Phycisphaerales bacterium]